MDNNPYADLQINGFMGVDFSAPDLTEDQFLKTAEHIFELGTTASSAQRNGGDSRPARKKLFPNGPKQ